MQNIKIYLAFLGASIKRMMEYRVDFIVGMTSQLVFQAIELIFIWIIFQATDSIAGWNFEQLLLIYGVMMLAVSITDFLFEATYGIGRQLIRNGKFDTILLRPVHPLVSILGDAGTNTAFGYMIIAIILIVSMLIKLQIPITIILIFKILFFGIIGAFIIGGIQTIVAISGLWTYKSNEVVWSFFQIYRLAEYPISIYNKLVRGLITVVLPFAFVAYYPTLEYMQMEGSKLAYLAPIAAVAIWIIAIKVWNWGLNKYRSTGN